MEEGSIEELEAICHFIDSCYYFIKKIKVYIDSTFFTPEARNELIFTIKLLKNLMIRCTNIILAGISFD
ncbi:hypothetical protein [Vallitalea guaymasensis]|uniref:Uncharacterized protein n=1 Tax=Vallitalea guaymasensis TaxID=1185412 RepID=A0A8J8SD22_9FIRM|nr:hypothetical protein [Vallitalea guaymasensis]QUH30279.1 hypothetical protein HYG85_15750 [Vallitalea guaymasensis]